MGLLSAVRKYLKYYPPLRKFVAYKVVPSGLFDSIILNYSVSGIWDQRVKLACRAPDNDLIPRVVNAGLILQGKQIMHNGLRINAGSYYGFEEAILIYKNRGVHEPLEELVFQEVLPSIKPGSVMIELGAFWSFYSMWFNKIVHNARNFMLEPDSFNLESGRHNFRLNGMSGEFRHCGVGEESGTMTSGVPIISIDDFVKDEGIEHVHLLHADIQGHEVAMLRGAASLFANQSVNWLFVSTHSENLHEDIFALLDEYGYPIVSAARPQESFSEDGIIVAKRKGIDGVEQVDISLRSAGI